MECKRARPPHLCGAPELFARSYPVQLRWPHGTTDFVLEQRPGKCDLFGGKPAVCCGHTVRLSKFVEPVVDEVVASFLAGCHRRACRAVDLGANIGLHTTAMLNMGATVTAVEPQPDLVEHIRLTAELNCAAQRLTVLNAFACAERNMTVHASVLPESQGICAAVAKKPPTTLYRPGVSTGHAESTPTLRLDQVLTTGAERAGGAVHIDLIKLDGDGPEVAWLAEIDRLMRERVITVGAMVSEGLWAPRQAAPVMERLQNLHSFDIYRLEAFDKRRLINRHGWDAFSPPGTFGRLDRIRTEWRDAHEEEILRLRTIGHVFKIKPNRTTGQWRRLLTPINNAFGTRKQYRYARVDLLFVHPSVEAIEPVEAPKAAWSVEAVAANYTNPCGKDAPAPCTAVA